MNELQVIESQKACFESWDVSEPTETISVLTDLKDAIGWEVRKLLSDDPEASVQALNIFVNSYIFYRAYLGADHE